MRNLWVVGFQIKGDREVHRSDWMFDYLGAKIHGSEACPYWIEREEQKRIKDLTGDTENRSFTANFSILNDELFKDRAGWWCKMFTRKTWVQRWQHEDADYWDCPGLEL